MQSYAFNDLVHTIVAIVDNMHSYTIVDESKYVSLYKILCLKKKKKFVFDTMF